MRKKLHTKKKIVTKHKKKSPKLHFFFRMIFAALFVLALLGVLALSHSQLFQNIFQHKNVLGIATEWNPFSYNNACICAQCYGDRCYSCTNATCNGKNQCIGNVRSASSTYAPTWFGCSYLGDDPHDDCRAAFISVLAIPPACKGLHNNASTPDHKTQSACIERETRWFSADADRYPAGTKLQVSYGGKSVIVEVIERGPNCNAETAIGYPILDLSHDTVNALNIQNDKTHVQVSIANWNAPLGPVGFSIPIRRPPTPTPTPPPTCTSRKGICLYPNPLDGQIHGIPSHASLKTAYTCPNKKILEKSTKGYCYVVTPPKPTPKPKPKPAPVHHTSTSTSGNSCTRNGGQCIKFSLFNNSYKVCSQSCEMGKSGACFQNGCNNGYVCCY